ncbi:MAG: hypothetical protein IJ091_11360 [Oscillospiraceae bacterium]|nr:hypothetical protein [Oscillospiraceae bacterium]MBQ8996397.1 hypothetical protein [Oscillospiraceae bacterium]
MAVGTGYSKPVIAIYSNSGNVVTYTDFSDLGRGVNISLDVTASDINNFYADNTVAETAGGVFSSGTGTATIDGLAPAVARKILGLSEPRTVQVDGSDVSVQGYGADEPPFCGFGYIYRHQNNGAVTYIATVLPKVKFNPPGRSAETQEESINWQTQELTFSIYRDDTSNAEWMNESVTEFSTETAAYAYLQAALS